MLQFITNTKSNASVVDQIHEAIEGGCRWIQIRMKDASDEDIKKIFFEIRDKAKETETIIILNDRVELAKELGEEGVAGVHLGKMDMTPAKARLFLGPQAIIGVTVNTKEDLVALKGLDIDYVGMGPFAHTETKEILAPVLGLEGIKELCEFMDEEKMETARVAVGGITLKDVDSLVDAGVNGIAVSGAIANAEKITLATEAFIEKLNKAD